jgi:hypothetical protein
MALEDSVNTLVTQTTALLNTVNVAKATLDTSVEDAGDFADAALVSANNAASSASTASTQATAAQTARTGAETARDAAIVAQNNAVEVVTGGTATLTPEAGKIPLADAQAKIDVGWLTETALVEQTDIGTAPNEIPLNQYLGSMAYQSLDNVVIENLTVTGQLNARQDLLVGSFTWNSFTSTPDSVFGRQQIVTGVHDKIRGCVLNVDGTVNYYLNPETWAEKDDGTASVLTGADGNVMVEIPKFYYRQERSGTTTTWKVSAVGQSGYKVHPAFIKDGVEVDFRYYGAYDACVYDDSASGYLAGLNLDDNTANVDLVNDSLASVKGIYPMIGLTRDEFRTLGENVGTGWRQLDFTLLSAVQMLYLIEYQSFFSQDILGAGNTNGTYVTQSANQSDSPLTIAGAGDAIANASTNVVSGAGVSAKPGTSFMKYRGIENLYGNTANWADGVNVNIGTAGTVYVTNNATNWADNTSTNYDLISSGLSPTTGFIRDLLPTEGYFLSASTTGASSTTYITDQQGANTNTNRVVSVSGRASDGANAGAFYVDLLNVSSTANRLIGGRLAY